MRYQAKWIVYTQSLLFLPNLKSVIGPNVWFWLNLYHFTSPKFLFQILAWSRFINFPSYFLLLDIFDSSWMQKQIFGPLMLSPPYPLDLCPISVSLCPLSVSLSFFLWRWCHFFIGFSAFFPSPYANLPMHHILQLLPKPNFYSRPVWPDG